MSKIFKLPEMIKEKSIKTMKNPPLYSCWQHTGKGDSYCFRTKKMNNNKMIINNEFLILTI